MRTARKKSVTVRNLPDYKNGKGDWVQAELETQKIQYLQKLTRAGAIWQSVKRRIKVNKHYSDVTLDFTSFQEFAEWCQNEIGYGAIDSDGHIYELDKDLLNPYLRSYSKLSCCFVPRYINRLLLTSKASRGDQPLGVSFHIRRNAYQANCYSAGKFLYLGLFTTSSEAHKFWQSAKIQAFNAAISRYQKETQVNPKVVAALTQRLQKLYREYLSDTETTEV